MLSMSMLVDKKPSNICRLKLPHKQLHSSWLFGAAMTPSLLAILPMDPSNRVVSLRYSSYRSQRFMHWSQDGVLTLCDLDFYALLSTTLHLMHLNSRALFTISSKLCKQR